LIDWLINYSIHICCLKLYINDTKISWCSQKSGDSSIAKCSQIWLQKKYEKNINLATMYKTYWHFYFQNLNFGYWKLNCKIHSIFLDFTFWLSVFPSKKKKLVRVPFSKKLHQKKKRKVGGGIFVNSISLVLIEFMY